MCTAVLVVSLTLIASFATADPDAEACLAGDRGCAAAPTAAELSLLQLEQGRQGTQPVTRFSISHHGQRQARQRPGPGKAGVGHPVNQDIVSPKRGLAIDTKHYRGTGKLCSILYKYRELKPWFYNYHANDAPPSVESDYQTCVFEHDSGFVPMEAVNEKGILKHPLVISEALLGFNEPNKGHVRLSPWEAAQLWPAMVGRSQESGIPRIGSPSASGDHMWEWFDAFFDECGQCQVDFLTVHVFKPSVLGPGSLQSVVAELHELYDLPIWVTEFNNGGTKHNKTMEQHLGYMQAALPLLESLPYVEKYAWHSTYSVDTPGASLIHKRSGKLTQLGQFYRDYRLPAAAASKAPLAQLIQAGEEAIRQHPAAGAKRTAGVDTTTLVLR